MDLLQRGQRIPSFAPSTLAPIDFPAWRQTRAELAAAIAAGPGLVVLVGPAGSGKTYSLAALAAGLDPARARIRTAGQPLEPGMAVDIVDAADALTLEPLLGCPVLQMVRVVAIVPEWLQRVVEVHPEARIVRMRPMASRDIRTMIEGRKSQLGLAADAITLKAISRLEADCAGNPRALDWLLGRARELAHAARVSRVTGAHVEAARLQLGATAASQPAGKPSQPRQTEAAASPNAGPTPIVLELRSLMQDAAPAARGVPPEARTAAPPAAAAVGGSAWAALRASSVDLAEIDRANVARKRSRQRSVVWAIMALAALVFDVGHWRETVATVKQMASGLTGRQIADSTAVASVPVASVPTAAVKERITDWASHRATTPLLPMPEPDRIPLPAPPVAGIPAVADPVPAAPARPAIPGQRAAPTAPGQSAAIGDRLQPAAAAPEAGRTDPEAAARLLSLGKTLLAIGQVADGRSLLQASAGLGNAEAASLEVSYRHAADVTVQAPAPTAIPALQAPR